MIEILSFQENSVVFGKAIFQHGPDQPAKNRIVFEYNKLNTMMLQLDKKEQLIVFDHLVPMDSTLKGNFEYYASDSSFDAYRLIGNRLKLLEDVDLKNIPNPQDHLYIDPKRKDISVTKKF